MNYSRLQFSKHSHYFLINYGYCTICASCAISDRNTFQLVEMIEDDLKCIFPEQNSDSSCKQISDKMIVFICGYATCPTYGTSGTNITIAITHQEIM